MHSTHAPIFPFNRVSMHIPVHSVINVKITLRWIVGRQVVWWGDDETALVCFSIVGFATSDVEPPSSYGDQLCPPLSSGYEQKKKRLLV
jgi:hypothetical protein